MLLLDIKNDTLHVWAAELSEYRDQYQHFLSLLDSDERVLAKRIVNVSVQQMFVLSHGWLRIVLGEYLGYPADQLVIAKASHGKPFLVDSPQLVFNLTHCLDKMLLAVAWDCQLGIDIEICQARARLEDIAKICLADEELAHWNALSDQHKITVFYQFWTRKEAFFKATGLGIGAGLQECIINPNQPDSFLKLPVQYGKLVDWYIINLDLWPDVSTVVVANKRFPVVGYPYKCGKIYLRHGLEARVKYAV